MKICIYLIFPSLVFSQDYTYSLEDINPNSQTGTFGMHISPEYFTNQITLHYFGKQT